MKLADQPKKPRQTGGGEKQGEQPFQQFKSTSSAASVPRGTKREIIKKSPSKANLENYEATYATFDWQDARKEIAYFANGKVNAAYNAVDRHMHDGRRNKVALYSID